VFLAPEIFLGCASLPKKIWTGIIKFNLVLTIMQNFTPVGKDQIYQHVKNIQQDNAPVNISSNLAANMYL